MPDKELTQEQDLELMINKMRQHSLETRKKLVKLVDKSMKTTIPKLLKQAVKNCEPA